MRKIYVVGGSRGYANWMQGELVSKMVDADLVVFTGGEDVHPDFYGHPIHPYTGANRVRDRYEMGEFAEARKLGKHIIGVCRGSQFLCVANGGALVQHQVNPSFLHDIKTYDGKVLNITSTHHQAAYPYGLPKDQYAILGWTEGLLPFHEDGNREEMNPEKECEIVYYPKGMSLGIQGHPEMMDIKHPTIDYLRHLLSEFMFNRLIPSNEPAEEVQTQHSLQTSYA